MDVVDVDQQAAAGASGDLDQKIDLVPVVIGQGQIGGRVLDQHPSPQGLLRLVQMVADQVQHLAASGYGQQVGMIDAATPRPGQVLGHHKGFEPIDQGAKTGQMLEVRAFIPGQGQTHAVQRQGPGGPDRLQPRQAGAAGDHVVLRVNLEPQAALGSDRRTGRGLRIMLGLQTQSGGRKGGHQRFGIAVSEPLPLGVWIEVQVPLATSFQALP